MRKIALSPAHLVLVLLAALGLFLTLNIHSRTGRFNYKSELFSDKAGYYIYLPATFVYGWDAAAAPAGLVDSTGRGFRLRPDGRVQTKYPAGVSILQLPFFLVTHYLVAPLSGQAQDGFSPAYHKMVDVAAWFYLILGLLLMHKVLSARFAPGTVAWVLLAFFLGSNLFYYGLVETGMSHVYSFFLVAALMRLAQRVQQRGEVDALSGWAMGLAIGLLVLVRFTNVLLLPALLLWEAGGLAAAKERLRMFLRPRALAGLLVPPLLFAGLQMAYYHYLSGDPFHYSYGDEGFDFLHPALLQFWFSPHNGWLPYAPVVVFAFVGLGRMWRLRQPGALLTTATVLGCSLVFASWWQWFYGCAYGARSMVELLPLLMVCLGHFVEGLRRQPRALRVAAVAGIAALCLLNFKNGYLYPLCYLGEGDWDWGYLWELSARF